MTGPAAVAAVRIGYMWRPRCRRLLYFGTALLAVAGILAGVGLLGRPRGEA